MVIVFFPAGGLHGKCVWTSLQPHTKGSPTQVPVQSSSEARTWMGRLRSIHQRCKFIISLFRFRPSKHSHCTQQISTSKPFWNCWVKRVVTASEWLLCTTKGQSLEAARSRCDSGVDLRCSWCVCWYMSPLLDWKQTPFPYWVSSGCCGADAGTCKAVQQCDQQGQKGTESRD